MFYAAYTGLFLRNLSPFSAPRQSRSILKEKPGKLDHTIRRRYIS